MPRVDVIHLHHGVWVSNFEPLFAAGEEKTVLATPPGYGWRYRTGDQWLMNHMIHNLTPTPADVYIEYELEFQPASAPLTEVRTLFMDVRGREWYPVFDVPRGAGRGRYTYPDEAGLKGYGRNRMTITEDGVLVGAGGHLHPGGLWTDLYLERGGRKVRLFRSRAKYFEPAGAVSWDVAMRVTPESWRVGVKRGDVLSISATYDSRRASWYEAMGIMQVGVRARRRRSRSVRGGRRRAGPDHPRPPEREPKSRRRLLGAGRPSPAARRAGARGRPGRDRRFRVQPRRPAAYRRAAAAAGRAARALADVRQPRRAAGRHALGHLLPGAVQPDDRDRVPARRRAGAVRLRQPRLRPAGFTAAAQRATWRTPKNLRAGLYTYFCRVHPFMRGSFRVKARGERR